MSLTLEEVEHIANLARLSLTPEELSRYREQLSAILDHFQELRAVDTEAVLPTASGFDLAAILREDQVFPGLELEELFHNAPDRQDQQFRVPPVFE